MVFFFFALCMELGGGYRVFCFPRAVCTPTIIVRATDYSEMLDTFVIEEDKNDIFLTELD